MPKFESSRNVHESPKMSFYLRHHLRNNKNELNEDWEYQYLNWKYGKCMNFEKQKLPNGCDCS